MVYGNPTTASGDAVFSYITAAAALCLSGRVSGYGDSADEQGGYESGRA